MLHADDPIRSPYDPEKFRELGHLFVDRVADYMADILEHPADVPVHPWMEPGDRASRWPGDFPAEGSEELLPLLDSYLSESIHLHHPRYIGHQVGPPLPVAALWDMIVALINNGTTIYEMSPAASMMERADSVIWDAHKMMLIPNMATFVLYRCEEDSWKAFTQKAMYVFTRGAEEEWYNLGHRTIECTKRTMSVLVYTALRLYGTRYFGEYVSSVTDLAHAFTAMLDEAPDFEPAVEPEMNIVCFRYRPEGMESVATAELDGLQERIRRDLLESGSFYMTQTELDGSTWLRTTITNPFTCEEDLSQLLEAIRGVAGTH